MRVFVFGSNLAGRHGLGSAKEAMYRHGAIWGKGVGFHGRSYAIPTKDHKLRVMPIEKIRPYVSDFIKFAKEHPEMEFCIVAVGCGLAGYTPAQMAPLFEGAPKNCIFATNWNKV